MTNKDNQSDKAKESAEKESLHKQFVEIIMENGFLIKEKSWESKQMEIRATYDSYRILNLVESYANSKEGASTLPTEEEVKIEAESRYPDHSNPHSPHSTYIRTGFKECYEWMKGRLGSEGWISVEDRLPEKEDYYEILLFKVVLFNLTSHLKEFDLYDVHYWRPKPLPEPPITES